jgi:hypothetical protein
LELFSDASAKTILLHAHGKKWSTRLFLTGLANHDEAHMSVWKDAQIAPENFGLSVPALLKSKTFKDAALDGKGPELERLLGTQNYNLIPEEFEPLLAGNHKYEEFLRATEASTSKIPLAFPWWCIAIFIVPGAGLFGLLIPRCRRG